MNGKDQNWHAKLSELLGDDFKLVAWDDRHEAFDADGKLVDADMAGGPEVGYLFHRGPTIDRFLSRMARKTPHWRRMTAGAPVWTAGVQDASGNTASFTESAAKGRGYARY